MLRAWQRAPHPRARVTEPQRSSEQGSGSKDILQLCKAETTKGRSRRPQELFSGRAVCMSLQDTCPPQVILRKSQKKHLLLNSPLPLRAVHRACRPPSSGCSGLPTVKRNFKRKANFVFPAASQKLLLFGAGPSTE